MDPSYELLPSPPPSQGVLRKRLIVILISVAMALSLLVGFIVASSVYLVQAGPTARQLDPFTLEDVTSGMFYGKGFNGSWVSDNEFSYRSAQWGISIYNVETGKISDFLAPEIAGQLSIANYKFSPDRNYILYSFDEKQSYRYSTEARYSVIDLLNAKVYPLQPQQLRTRGLKDPQLFLNYATWTKDGNSLVYVHDNDIYFRRMPDVTSADIRLTNDGQKETIFNGIPDWVYEEEVLSTDNAIWISKNGERLVFAKFDDTPVDNMEYSIYGDPGEISSQYPQTASIRYPKPGRKNPIVSLWSVALNELDGSNGLSVSQPLAVPESLRNKDYYFTTVAWADDDEVMIAWMNRHQNISFLSFCNVTAGTCKSETVITESNGWVDFYSAPKFSSDGRRYLIVLPVPEGEAGNFKHLVLRDRDTNDIRTLTSGRWEVTELLGWDEEREIAYFVGTATNKPSVRHVYKVITKEDADPALTCMTCGTMNVENKECTYNNGDFSTEFTYYVHGCDGPSVPRSVIRNAEVNTEVFVVEDNLKLRDRLAQKSLPRPMNLHVPLEGNYTAQVRLLLPPSLNRNRAMKYPLLVYVYGGPQSQQVSDRYKVDWGTHLASARGVIYALIDGRGSGYQGDKMLHEIYRRMGTVEIQDQIAVTKYLVENLHFVDGNRTAIWGWSYGGFASASALARDSENVFKCAMSVAPVTNWIYYDSIYTERYMGLPTADDNEKGYEDSDLCRMAENFRNKKFYLIHGTADDNVHYQQSLLLAKALESADILFRQQTYTDENHSISRLRTHLYHSLGAFLMSDCFELEKEIWG